MAADSLLHLTDLHFWEVVVNPLRLLNKRFLGNLNVWLRRRNEFPFHQADQHLEEISATGIPHLLITGDFTSTATDKECALGAAFTRRLEERGLHLHLLPGNHDLYTFESRRRGRFQRHFGPWMPPEGYPAVRCLPGGTPLILVPTVCPNLLSARGRVTGPDISAAARLLESGPSPALVAGHYPLLHETYAYKAPPLRRLRNAEALRRALGKANRPILYLSGHVHRFSFARDPEFPNLAHLSTGAFFRFDPLSGTRAEFSEVHVQDHGFRVVRHTRTDRWTATEEPARP